MRIVPSVTSELHIGERKWVTTLANRPTFAMSVAHRSFDVSTSERLPTQWNSDVPLVNSRYIRFWNDRGLPCINLWYSLGIKWVALYCTNKKEVNDMSDYHYRNKMMGTTCHQCDDGTITGSHSSVSCDNPDCNFMF